MVMYDNGLKTKENKSQTKDKIEPQHIISALQVCLTSKMEPKTVTGHCFTVESGVLTIYMHEVKSENSGWKFKWYAPFCLESFRNYRLMDGVKQTFQSFLYSFFQLIWLYFVTFPSPSVQLMSEAILREQVFIQVKLVQG